MDFQSHFYQRQGQEGAAIGSSKAASLWQKGAFERLKGKQGTWHPFFLWQLLGMFLTTPLKIKISALKGGEFNSAPSYPFSTVLSKAARGVCIRQSLRAWVDLQLAAHQNDQLCVWTQQDNCQLLHLHFLPVVKELLRRRKLEFNYTPDITE